MEVNVVWFLCQVVYRAQFLSTGQVENPDLIE